MPRVAPPSGSISGSAIAGDALKYVGRPYVYGGSPGPSGTNGWDCSSFVNWVLGHDFNLKLPGSVKPGYSGTSHGPVVVGYSTWTGAQTVLQPQAGDLCIWVGLGVSGHIGIATSPQKMVSALNPGLGTLQTPIQGTGPAGAPLVFRHITATGNALSSLGGCVPVAGLIWKLMHHA